MPEEPQRFVFENGKYVKFEDSELAKRQQAGALEPNPDWIDADPPELQTT